MSTRLLIVGAGNMGGALARGVISEAAGAFDVHVCDRHGPKRDDLKSTPGITVISDLSAIASAYDLYVLAVKPQDLPKVAEDLAGNLPAASLVVSLLAGTPLKSVATSLGFAGDLVRAMPNVAATIGHSATVLCSQQALPEDRQALVQKLFGAVGETHWGTEEWLDAVTGLSGSGPAYVYMIIDALTEGGVKMGLPHELSSALAVKTVLGAAAMVQESGLHPSQLKDRVTTPGGTTIHAVHELESHGLRSMLISAVETATKHSKALARLG